MEVKLDKATLPKDGQYVKFQSENGNWYIGYFVEGENLFSFGNDDFIYAWNVIQWEPM